jgi:hypothetical protein
MSKVARIFEVLENSLWMESPMRRPKKRPYALTPELPVTENQSCYAALVHTMMQARQESDGGSVFTFVAIRSGDGVSHVVKAVGAELARDTGEKILVTSLQGVNTVQRQDLQDCRRRFGYVLVDCPAMNVSRDYMKLSKLSDSFVLVVKAGSTTRQEIDWAQRALAAQSVNILGLVLNQREAVLPPFLSTIL